MAQKKNIRFRRNDVLIDIGYPVSHLYGEHQDELFKTVEYLRKEGFIKQFDLIQTHCQLADGSENVNSICCIKN